MISDTIKLINQGDQEYISEDGRIRVVLDRTFETECDGEHPVKMRLDEYTRYYTTPEAAQAAVDKMIMFSGAKVIGKRTKEGWVQYITWQCRGGESHYYSQWTSEVDSDWTEIVTDTLTETVGSLEKLLDARIILGRKAKVPMERKRVLDPVTGSATWAACGHRAELDINEDCYTCHQPPLVPA